MINVLLLGCPPPDKIFHSPSTRGGFSPPNSYPYLENPDQLNIQGFLWHTINYTVSGYMLNADGHLID